MLVLAAVPDRHPPLEERAGACAKLGQWDIVADGVLTPARGGLPGHLHLAASGGARGPPAERRFAQSVIVACGSSKAQPGVRRQFRGRLAAQAYHWSKVRARLDSIANAVGVCGAELIGEGQLVLVVGPHDQGRIETRGAGLGRWREHVPSFARRPPEDEHRVLDIHIRGSPHADASADDRINVAARLRRRRKAGVAWVIVASLDAHDLRLRPHLEPTQGGDGVAADHLPFDAALNVASGLGPPPLSPTGQVRGFEAQALSLDPAEAAIQREMHLRFSRLAALEAGHEGHRLPADHAVPIGRLQFEKHRSGRRGQGCAQRPHQAWQERLGREQPIEHQPCSHGCGERRDAPQQRRSRHAVRHADSGQFSRSLDHDRLANRAGQIPAAAQLQGINQGVAHLGVGPLDDSRGVDVVEPANQQPEARSAEPHGARGEVRVHREHASLIGPPARPPMVGKDEDSHEHQGAGNPGHEGHCGGEQGHSPLGLTQCVGEVVPGRVEGQVHAEILPLLGGLAATRFDITI